MVSVVNDDNRHQQQLEREAQRRETTQKQAENQRLKVLEKSRRDEQLKAKKELERKKKAEQKARDKLRKDLQREANLYAPRIIQGAFEAGVRHKLARDDAPGKKGKQRYQRIKIVESKGNKDALYFRVHPRLPWDTSYSDLEDTETLRRISGYCRRPVKFFESPETGGWFVLWRADSINRIPSLFQFGTALAKLEDAIRDPNQEVGPLTFCVGASQNGYVIYESLAKIYNLLVAGEVGTGKSNFLNALIITLAYLNDPSTVRFALIDLKGRQAFGRFSVLKDYLFAPVTGSPEEALQVLIDLKAEMMRRSEMMGSRNCESIVDWNRLYPDEALPYIVCIVDELAELLRGSDKKISKEANRIVGSIVSMGRAPGVFNVYATQSPRREVIQEGTIKPNMSRRLCFSVATHWESRIVIGSPLAADLEPEGRAVYRRGAKLRFIQAPHLADGVIFQKLREIQKREGIVPMRKDWNVIEIMEYALDTFPVPNGAKLPAYKLYKQFRQDRPGFTQAVMDGLLEELQARREIINVRGNKYFVVNKGRGGNLGWRLELYTGDTEIESAPTEPIPALSENEK